MPVLTNIVSESSVLTDSIDGNVKPGQKEYTIVLLMPFHSEKVFITDLNETSNYYFPEESQLAAAYYQGCLLALDSLAKKGFSAKLLVYDVGTDTARLQSILLSPELKGADLIIGPLANKSLRIATEFSTVNHIWLVSPFSTTAIGDSASPFYLLANATMKTHCEKICEYISRTQYSGKIFLLYKKRPAELELVKYLKEHQQLQHKDPRHELEFVELTDSSETKFRQVATMLSDSNKNIIIVPSNDESFVLSMLKQLSSLTDKYLINVFGMPTWINFDRIPNEHLLKVSAHITQNFWLDKELLPVTRFYQKYSEKYQMNPSSYAVKGFDQMFYCASMLMKFGKGLDTAFLKQPGNGLAEVFSIAPVSFPPAASDTLTTVKPSTWYYENKEVLMLRFEENGWKKIPE